MRTSSHHDTFHRARARMELSFLSFSFIMNFISPHVFKRAFAYLLLSLLGFRVGSSPFPDPIREALSLCGPLFSMIMLGVGCGPQVGPFLSRPTMGSIRGEGTPPQTLAVI